MAKVLTCSSIFPECDFEVRAESQEDVMQAAVSHARVVHNILEIDDETARLVVAAIKDG